jgi:hypothetical protein
MEFIGSLIFVVVDAATALAVSLQNWFFSISSKFPVSLQALKLY